IPVRETLHQLLGRRVAAASDNVDRRSVDDRLVLVPRLSVCLSFRRAGSAPDTAKRAKNRCRRKSRRGASEPPLRALWSTSIPALAKWRIRSSTLNMGGYLPTKAHWYVMGVTSNPMCTPCGEEEKSWLFRCEHLEHPKQTIFGSRVFEPEDIRLAGSKTILTLAMRAGLGN
ncbi:unnamed protein product, partial [Callosobruchus maculatus]